LSGNYLLKLHGDIDHGQIVLSRDDFAAVHLLRRPLIGIVQEKLLIGHLLTIGSTVSDPTLVQAAEEVGALLTRMNGQNARPSGTVLLTKNDLSRSMLLSRHFQVLAAQSRGDQVNTTLESARRTDIFLDQLAMLSSSNFSFALDPKYAGMLTSEDQKTVAALTRLTQEVDVTDSHAPKSGLGMHVASFLRDLGA